MRSVPISTCYDRQPPRLTMPGKRYPNGPVPDKVRSKKYRDKLRETDSVPLLCSCRFDTCPQARVMGNYGFCYKHRPKDSGVEDFGVAPPAPPKCVSGKKALSAAERQQRHRTRLKAAEHEALLAEHEALLAKHEALIAKTAALEVELAASKVLVSFLELDQPETPIATVEF